MEEEGKKPSGNRMPGITAAFADHYGSEWGKKATYTHVTALVNDPARPSAKVLLKGSLSLGWSELPPERVAPLASLSEDGGNEALREMYAEVTRLWRSIRQQQSDQKLDRTPEQLAEEKSEWARAEVPALFFAEPFDLAAFEPIWQSNRSAAEEMTLEMHLAYYLDSVEQALVAQISRQSESFFSALSSLQELHQQVHDVCRVLRMHRLRLDTMDRQTVVAAYGILRLLVRARNLLAVHEKLEMIGRLAQLDDVLQELFMQGDFLAALELFEDAEKLLQGPLKGVVVAGHLVDNIRYRRSMMEDEMHGYLVKAVEECLALDFLFEAEDRFSTSEDAASFASYPDYLSNNYRNLPLILTYLASHAVLRAGLMADMRASITTSLLHLAQALLRQRTPELAAAAFPSDSPSASTLFVPPASTSSSEINKDEEIHSTVSSSVHTNHPSTNLASMNASSLNASTTSLNTASISIEVPSSNSASSSSGSIAPIQSSTSTNHSGGGGVDSTLPESSVTSTGESAAFPASTVDGSKKSMKKRRRAASKNTRDRWTQEMETRVRALRFGDFLDVMRVYFAGIVRLQTRLNQFYVFLDRAHCEDGLPVSVVTSHRELGRDLLRYVSGEAAQMMDRYSTALVHAPRSDFFSFMRLLGTFLEKLDAEVQHTAAMALLSARVELVDAYLDEFHDSQLQRLKLALDVEQWGLAAVSEDQRVALAALEQPLLSSSSTSAAIEGGGEGGGGNGSEEDVVQLLGQSYHVVPVALVVLAQGQQYLDLMGDFAASAGEVVTRLVQFLSHFCRRLKALILDAEALTTAKLKSITVKHLALSSATARFVAALTTVLRKQVERRNLVGASKLAEFDHVPLELAAYGAMVATKMVNILSDRVDFYSRQYTKMEFRKFSGEPSETMKALTHEIAVLHRVIAQFLDERESRTLTARIMDVLTERLRGCLLALPAGNPVVSEVLSMDIEVLCIHLNKLSPDIAMDVFNLRSSLMLVLESRFKK